MSITLTFALALTIMTMVQAGRVLLTLYALRLGAEPFAIGILAATFSLLPMLLSWQVGRLSDRFGSRWLLLAGTVGGAFGMLLPCAVPELFTIFVAGVTNGLMFAFSGVCLQNLVGLQSTPQTTARNFSNYSMLISATGFIGPLLAGFSVDHSGPAAASLRLALLSLLPAVLLLAWGALLPQGSREVRRGGGVRDMLAESGLWRVLATSSLVVTGIDLFQVYVPIYGHEVGLSASAIGIVLAMFSAAAFVVRMALPFLISRLTEERALAYSFFIGAASFLLMPFFRSTVVLSLIAFAFGLGMGCGQPITLMMTYSTSLQGRSGEAMGLRVTVNHLTRVVVPILFGSVGSAFGLLPVFWSNALMLLSGGAITKPGRTART